MTDMLDEGLELDALDHDTVTEDNHEHLSLAMFEGDTSTLFKQQRLCLHALLKNRYISADRHPDHWAVLTSNPDPIRSRLHDLFLDLRIDHEHRIAFKQAAGTRTEPLPSLLRNVAHTKEETIVMVYLRQRFHSQRQEGDDVVFVEREALLDEVADRRPEHATNRAMDFKRANAAIDSVATAGVLLRTSDPDRFQVSPVIEVLLPIEKLRALWAWLIEANRTDADDDQRDDPDTAEDAGAPDLFDQEDPT